VLAVAEAVVASGVPALLFPEADGLVDVEMPPHPARTSDVTTINQPSDRNENRRFIWRSSSHLYHILDGRICDQPNDASHNRYGK
jgi:hypothetical protein